MIHELEARLNPILAEAYRFEVSGAHDAGVSFLQQSLAKVPHLREYARVMCDQFTTLTEAGRRCHVSEVCGRLLREALKDRENG